MPCLIVSRAPIACANISRDMIAAPALLPPTAAPSAWASRIAFSAGVGVRSLSSLNSARVMRVCVPPMNQIPFALRSFATIAGSRAAAL
jgi:hypothetical protein